MLQIITGKFFTTDDLYVTHHRGVLYTNYQLDYLKSINTSVGSISPNITWGDTSRNGVYSLAYEYDERLEAVRPNGQKEFLLSIAGDCIIQDFSAVVAFALNVTCTPDLDTTRRLTQSKHASSAALTHRPGASMTDIQNVIGKIEGCVPGLAKAEQRLPMLTLYLLFHYYVPPEYHRPNWKKFFEKYSDHFNAPSIESMLAHVLTGYDPGWSLDEFVRIRDVYFKQRYKKGAIAVGSFFETAITLFLAELYRQKGEVVYASKFVCEAVENLPGHERLLEFERAINETTMPSISWQEILLPPKAVNPQNKAEENEENVNHN